MLVLSLDNWEDIRVDIQICSNILHNKRTTVNVIAELKIYYLGVIPFLKSNVFTQWKILNIRKLPSENKTEYQMELFSFVFLYSVSIP